MKLAKFWGRDSIEVDDVQVTARGWSDDSMDAAKAKAREVAQRVAQRVLSGGPKERYPYGDRPLPEPLIKQFPGGSAIVTRNLYGALILNTDEMMFVDIDAENGRAPDVDVEAVAAQHWLSGRFYETFAGYRVILTDRKFVASSPEAEAMLKAFGADKMYTHLCKMQQSFRARLTPKPWRCEWHKPPVAYPYESPFEEQEFQQWVRRYDAQAAGYSTWKLASTFGALVLPEFGELIAYHDQLAKAESSLPLA